MSRTSWWILGAIALLTVLLILVNRGPVAAVIVRTIASLELSYEKWLGLRQLTNPIILVPGAFLGGLIASVSPCILSLLPVNLSYIGSTELTNRREAVLKSSLFVAGTVTVLSVMGLFSSIAGLLLVNYRGYVNLLIGSLMLAMGLVLLEVIQVSLPAKVIPFTHPHPYLVGMTFSLVISPCTSPVFFSILAAAGTSGHWLLSMITMISYGIGYTLIIFLCSLFAGLARQTRLLLKHSQLIIRIASVVLVLTGGYYVVDGVSWVWPRS